MLKRVDSLVMDLLENYVALQRCCSPKVRSDVLPKSEFWSNVLRYRHGDVRCNPKVLGVVIFDSQKSKL